MAIIKTLKENELMGGMENEDLYPISSTQAIFSQDSDGAFPKGVKPLLEDRLKDHEALLAKHTSEIKNIANAGYFNVAKLWQILADNTDEQINISHLTDALSNYALKSELPKKLKTLTFDGLIKGSYNGSEDITLTFPTNISAFTNDAHYVTKAELGDTSLDSAAQEWVRSNFISKVVNDTAQGIITFNKGLISFANTYIGSENESSYLKYDAATKQILIKGSLSASTTIDGLAIKDYIKQNGISEDELNNLLQGIKNDLQSQLDGSIETWYYEGEPTLENLPAKDWDTDEKKKAHSGDLYYDKSTGKAYRFTFDTDHYLWLVITDSDITKALKEAAKAQETADGKMTVFTTSKNTLPTPPYQVGDIWVNAYYGEYANELLRCVRGRSGEVGDTASINDWIKASKYTDDSAFDKFKGDYLLSIQSYKRQLDGTVVTWFGDEAPSLNNAPVSGWSEQDKADHAGDLYYDRTSHEVYKWSGATWFVVNDPKLQEALELASKAQDTADSKRTTFLSQPKGPYDEGDQWIVTTTGEDGTVTRTLMVCIKGTTTEGYFSQDDWVKSNDADLNEYAKLIEESLNGLKDQLDKKAETWYQAEDPSTAWTTDELKALHKGDLWYNTTDNTTWYYNGVEWVQQDVPDGVFDKIDGKSAVYIEKPLKGYNVRDLWILEAEYTLYGGVTYKAGELVTALNSRAEGEWEATDWIKKVNYTDDTLAQDALNKIGETNKVVANLNTTVTDFKNAFDEYTKDGYLEGAEIAALKHDMDRIQDAYNASKASYDKIYATINPDNYTDETDKAKATEVKANLKTAFDKLTEHLKIAQTIKDAIDSYNTLSDEDKTTTYARVSGYFTNFTTYYNDFCTALNAAYDFIFNDLYSGLTEAVGQTKYLREAILQGSTDINGGLILSSMLALRDKNNDDGTPGAVMSGINGVTDSTDSHRGIATWWGGKMIDRENNPNNETPATAVIRFDGSGYFANGNISWGPTGTVTIKDLTSLWGTDDTNILQNMSLFTSGTYGSEEIGTEVLILPKMKFGELFIRRLNSKDLENNDVVLTQGELKDRFVTKEWFNKIFCLVDDKQKDLAVNGDTASATAIRAKMDLYSEKGITALGYSSSSSGSSGGTGGGGLDAEMLWSILGNSGTEQISKSHLTEALAGYATEEWIEGKGYLTSHQDISGKADRSELLGYLPLTGGTLTGNLNLGSNTLFAENLSLTNVTDNWNFNHADNRLRFLYCTNKATIGAPGQYWSGISAITGYTGFQLATYGGNGTGTLYFRTVWDTDNWSDWYKIYHEGFKPTKADVGLGNVDNTADANKSVNYATTASKLDSSAGSETYPIYFKDGKPVKTDYSLEVSVKRYFGSLASSGWELAGGLTKGSIIQVSYNNKPAPWNSGVYSSSLVFGTGDIKGMLDCHYYTPIVSFGGSQANESKDSPSWYFKLRGTSECTYTFPASSKTLAANDGSNATGTWGINITGNAGSANSVAWSNVSGKPTTLSEYGITDGLYCSQESAQHTTLDWIKAAANSHRRAFIYNTSGEEYSYLIGMENYSSQVRYGAILKMGYADTYLRILRMYSGKWPSDDWEKISAGYADSAAQVTNSLSWSGYSSGSYNGSTAQSISIPNNTNQLTNGAGYITSSASITGNAATATKLQTARTIWGQRFDGTDNITGRITCDRIHIGNTDELWCDTALFIQYGNSSSANVCICASSSSNVGSGNVGIGTTTPTHKLHVNGDMATTGRAIVDSLQIGNITIIYDEANKGLRIAGGGLYTDSYLSSLGVDASTALSVKKWADSIQITTESDAELATAYSIGNLYRLINSNQKTITESLNQSVSALQGRCTSLENRVLALENKVNK